MIGTLTEKPGGFIHGCTKSPPSSLHSSVGDTHKALQLKPVLGRGVFLTIPFRAGSALAILVSAAHSTAQPVEGCGCSLGIEEHICHGGAAGGAEPLLVSQPGCRDGDPSAGRAFCSSCCSWGWLDYSWPKLAVLAASFTNVMK